jgi:hypothetical protein
MAAPPLVGWLPYFYWTAGTIQRYTWNPCHQTAGTSGRGERCGRGGTRVASPSRDAAGPCSRACPALQSVGLNRGGDVQRSALARTRTAPVLLADAALNVSPTGDKVAEPPAGAAGEDRKRHIESCQFRVRRFPGYLRQAGTTRVRGTTGVLRTRWSPATEGRRQAFSLGPVGSRGAAVARPAAGLGRPTTGPG